MKKAIKFLVCIFLFGIPGLSVEAQSCDCIHLDSSQKKLFLNGENFTLIDNALRCFKLRSIAEEKDSIVRIWLLESNYPDTQMTWRVKMFEFGKRGNIPFATLHILDWGYENDSSFPVKCIKQENIPPNQGWLEFEKDVRRLNLPILYEKPFQNPHNVTVDFGMLVIQFLFGNNTYTVDFTGQIDLSKSANAKQQDYSKRMLFLFWYIEQHFSIRLSADLKGNDFLKDDMIKLNLTKSSER